MNSALTKPPLSGYTPTVLEAQKEGEVAEEVVMHWRIHRLREHPRGIALVALGYGIAFALWWLVFPYPLGLFLPVFALTGAMSEYLFPIEYKLTTKGAYANCGPAIRLFLGWDEVRRATHGSEGVYLSTLKIPSRLDNFRGIRLRFAEGNEEAVRQTVRRFYKKEVPA